MRESNRFAEHPILLCAALGIEARACRSGVARAGKCFEVLQTGMGAERAARALRARLLDADRPRPSCVISTGFAGSLVEELEPLDWILATRIGSITLPEEPLARILSGSPLKWKRASVHSSLEVVGSDRLPAPSDAVDLESEALSGIARGEGIPFRILRMISDAPSRPLPDAIRHFSSGRMTAGASHAVRQPRALARFIAHAARLPRELERGWSSCAQAIADAQLFESGGRERKA